ncbi:ATP-dependent DNA helicase RecG [Fusibacter sp. JL298sf-3]
MLNKPLTVLPGVGDKKAEKLKKIGLETFGDLIRHYPMRYEDRRQVKGTAEIPHDETGVICAEVVSKRVSFLSRNKKELMVLKVKEHYFEGDILFFNPKYIKNDFLEGETYFFYGKLERQGAFFKMVQPEYAHSKQTAFLKIVPVYPLTLGVTNREMTRLVELVLARGLHAVEDALPESLLKTFELCRLKEAYRDIHFPKDAEAYKRARKRLVFNELFELQLRLLLLKSDVDDVYNVPYVPKEAYDRWVKTLPFELTEAQQGVLKDIQEDVYSGRNMNRLIQGDVGSGKTIVAFAAIYLTVLNGHQAVLMVPTSLLAEQHFEAFEKMLPKEVRPALLTSATKAAEKRRIKAAVQEGTIDVLIGTHAVIQDDVGFSRLGLVVTDEQHRFGIKQRLRISEKGARPHVLVMSATPIPRTLSLILYGDMSVSTIDVLPSGRKAIKTHFVSTSKVRDMYAFVKKALSEGRQAYVVCPLVEASETMDLHSATEHYEQLQNTFDGFRIGMVHGKMKAKEKDAVMHAFKEGAIQLLVSTTVIEVGINVPNATVMMIMNVERFGLAQLHQLRGRVGRGSEQSYCFLLSDKLSKTAKERVQTLVNSSDGFDIAQKDLEIRGPGEVFGLRQHGLPELKLANLSRDKNLLAQAQKCVKIVVTEHQMGNAVFQPIVEQMKRKNTEGFTL